MNEVGEESSNGALILDTLIDEEKYVPPKTKRNLSPAVRKFVEEKNIDISDEIADILWVLICISNQTGVDLTKAFKENLKKKDLRDSKRHLQNNKLQ